MVMKKTSTMKEYLFDNGWRGQIETHEKGTDITIFDTDNSVVLTDNLNYAKNLSEVLEGLLNRIKKED